MKNIVIKFHQESPPGSTSDIGRWTVDPVSISTEDMIRALTINVTKMQQDMSQYPQETVLKELNLENQLKQVANIVNHIGEEEEEEELTEGAQPEEENLHYSTPSPAIPENMPPFPEALRETERVEKDEDKILNKCEDNSNVLFAVANKPREYHLDFFSFTNMQEMTVELSKNLIPPLMPPRSKHFPLTMLNDNFFPSLSPHESMKIWIFDPGKIFKVKGQKIKHSYGSPRSENVAKINYHDPSLND
ncbi:unnamed protein product [Cuscuta europaea]|uniref:Uncharacterized protein n=1 Tax=Cuscuta europaea TaxID=41803 RepID=A0A9P0ZIT2_CUSEU|nr:unnamed protein product [Cuscuta europaea]CAH9100591.1 unnamed protein product [Cuscuta europaea]